MANRTSLNIMLAAIMLVAALSALIGEEVAAENGEAADIDTFVVDYISYEIISDDTVEVDGVSDGYPDTIGIPSTVSDGMKDYSVTSIGDYAFRGCINLSHITMQMSITSIGRESFYGCTSLSDITILSSVKSIGADAFHGCISLSGIMIPNGVEALGYYAFCDCISLLEITIPNSATFVGDNAFRGCISLSSISVGADNPNYSSTDGVLFDKEGKTLIQYPLGSTESTYEIPNGVETVYDSSFDGCASIETVTIPDSVESIGYYAFRGCISLSEITIPDSVESIGEHVFSGCTSLKKATIGNSIKSIGVCFFNGCTSLSEITIPDSVESIGSFAFRNCVSLSEITIPDSVESIGSFAFRNCASLKSVAICACHFDYCGTGIFKDVQLEFVSIDKEATGFSDIFSEYKFYDADGNELTEEKDIAGHVYKIDENGNAVIYVPSDGNGPNIGLIIGIIIVIMAIVGIGAYFFVRSKKQ